MCYTSFLSVKFITNVCLCICAYILFFFESWYLNFYQHTTNQRWQTASSRLNEDHWHRLFALTDVSKEQTKKKTSVPTFANCEISCKNLEFLILMKGWTWCHCIFPWRFLAGAELLWTLPVEQALCSPPSPWLPVVALALGWTPNAIPPTAPHTYVLRIFSIPRLHLSVQPEPDFHSRNLATVSLTYN